MEKEVDRLRDMLIVQCSYHCTLYTSSLYNKTVHCGMNFRLPILCMTLIVLIIFFNILYDVSTLSYCHSYCEFLCCLYEKMMTQGLNKKVSQLLNAFRKYDSFYKTLRCNACLSYKLGI